MAPFAECLECRRIGPLVADLPAQVANLQGDCEALRAEANAAKVGFLDRLAGAGGSANQRYSVARAEDVTHRIYSTVFSAPSAILRPTFLTVSASPLPPDLDLFVISGFVHETIASRRGPQAAASARSNLEATSKKGSPNETLPNELAASQQHVAGFT